MIQAKQYSKYIIGRNQLAFYDAENTATAFYMLSAVLHTTYSSCDWGSVAQLLKATLEAYNEESEVFEALKEADYEKGEALKLWHDKYMLDGIKQIKKALKREATEKYTR